MKKRLSLAALSLSLPLGLWQCAPIVNVVAPSPNKLMVQNSGYPLNNLKEGHGVYMRKCAECHDYRIPGMYPTIERHQLVSGMSHSAGLSKDEEAMVQKYLDAASER